MHPNTHARARQRARTVHSHRSRDAHIHRSRYVPARMHRSQSMVTLRIQAQAHALTFIGHVTRTSTRARSHIHRSRDAHKHTRKHTYARTQAHAHASLTVNGHVTRTSTRARTHIHRSRDAHAHICKDTSTRARIAHSQSHSHVTRTSTHASLTVNGHVTRTHIYARTQANVQEHELSQSSVIRCTLVHAHARAHTLSRMRTKYPRSLLLLLLTHVFAPEVSNSSEQATPRNCFRSLSAKTA